MDPNIAVPELLTKRPTGSWEALWDRSDSILSAIAGAGPDWIAVCTLCWDGPCRLHLLPLRSWANNRGLGVILFGGNCGRGDWFYEAGTLCLRSEAAFWACNVETIKEYKKHLRTVIESIHFREDWSFEKWVQAASLWNPRT